jgi:hypothetical protein
MHDKLNSMTLHVKVAGGLEPGYLLTEDSAKIMSVRYRENLNPNTNWPLRGSFYNCYLIMLNSAGGPGGYLDHMKERVLEFSSEPSDFYDQNCIA